jgi:hypothetical protein
MLHIGSPENWLEIMDNLVSDIIEMVIDTWGRLPPPAVDEQEDRISESLCIALRDSSRRSGLPLQIQSQQNELAPAPGQNRGRMDITFMLLVQREDIYFAFECKRLNVKEDNNKVRPYFSEYVRSGMSRFVSGQYAPAVRNGGMLAFVLNGDINGAIIGVENNIRAHHAELNMDPPGVFAASSTRPDDPRVRETVHRRTGSLGQFTIHHLFMAGDPNAPPRG